MKGAVAAIREAHHKVAKLIAAGLDHDVIAEKLGRPKEFIKQYLSAPANRELVAQFKALLHE